MAFIVLHDKNGREVFVEADHIATVSEWEVTDEIHYTLVTLDGKDSIRVLERAKAVVAMAGGLKKDVDGN